MSRVTFRQFLGGIALFLFALDLIEDRAKSGGSLMQRGITFMTRSKRKSLFLGVGLVNVLQSSHAVSLIILALVGSGMIALNQAISVVIGMNVGSVFMEALIGLFGLGFDMKPVVMPMIAVGGLGAFFSKRYRNIFLIIMSLGMVFLGLEYMKESIKFLKESIDLSQYTQIHRLWFILIGLIGTVMTQSSSAMTIIVMTALSEKILGFEGAAATLMGAYIGSSTTALVVAFVSGSTIKKQVALSHFGFNIITCLLFAVFFPYITHSITTTRGFGSNLPWFGQLTKSSVNGLIVFFLLFKTVGGLIHIPFIDHIAKLLTRLIPDKSSQHLGIENADKRVNIHVGLSIIQNDLHHIRDKHLGLIADRFSDPGSFSDEQYDLQKNDYNKLFQYIVQFPFDKLTDSGSSKKQSDKQGVMLMDSLQESMQALTFCKDSVKVLAKIKESPDAQSTLYLQELQPFIDSIIDKLKKGDTASARTLVTELTQWDEHKMNELLQKGVIPSSGVVELIQIHDHIHGSLVGLIDAKERLSVR